MKASPFAGELSSGSDQPESHPVQAEGTSKDIKHRHDKEKKQLKIVGQKPPPLVSRKQKAPKELEGLNTSRLKGLHFGELAPSPEKVQPAKRPAGVPTSSVMRAKMLKERQRQEQMIIEERQKKVKSVVAPIKRVLAVPFKPLTAVWRFLFGKGGGGDHSIRESWNALSAEQRLVVAGGLASMSLFPTSSIASDPDPFQSLHSSASGHPITSRRQFHRLSRSSRTCRISWPILGPGTTS